MRLNEGKIGMQESASIAAVAITACSVFLLDSEKAYSRGDATFISLPVSIAVSLAMFMLMWCAMRRTGARNLIELFDMCVGKAIGTVLSIVAALIFILYAYRLMARFCILIHGRVFAAAWVFWQQQQIENPLCIRHIADMKPDGDLIRRILGIGIPSGLENGMFQIGKLCVSSLTSTLGTSAIAANAVANTISGIANIPGSTMGLAMIPVVSRCLGAGDKKQAKHYAKMFILMAMLGLFCTNACLFFTIPYIARLFSLSDTALNMCVTVMHWFSLFSVVCWATSFTLPNALRSGGDARYTMTVSIFSMWLFRVILSYIFVLKLNMGLTGVWFGMFIDWICRSVFFMIRFVSNKWMDHNVI